MTESLDESHKLYKGLIFFGSVIFMNLFFGCDFSWYLFFWIPQKCLGRAPLSCTCQSTLPVVQTGISKNFASKVDIYIICYSAARTEVLMAKRQIDRVTFIGAHSRPVFECIAEKHI